MVVVGFGWKFRVKRGKHAEITSEYRYWKLSTGTQRVVFGLEDSEYRY